MKRAPYTSWFAISAGVVGLTLAGCATTTLEVQVKTVTVDLPTPIVCVPADSPAPPVYADTPEALKAARDYAERDGLVKGEWAKHQAREAYLESLRSICMKVAP